MKKNSMLRKMKKYSFIISLLTSLTTSLFVCMFFMRAGAVNVVPTGFAGPYNITVSTQSSDRQISTSNIITPITNSCDQYYDLKDNTCELPWSGGGYKMDGSRYVAYAYQGQCPSGQVMTGYKWGGANSFDWSGRYLMVPECSTLTFHVAHT